MSVCTILVYLRLPPRQACLPAALEESSLGLPSFSFSQNLLFCKVFPKVRKASSVDVILEAFGADAGDLCVSVVVCLFQADLGKVNGAISWGG